MSSEVNKNTDFKGMVDNLAEFYRQLEIKLEKTKIVKKSHERLINICEEIDNITVELHNRYKEEVDYIAKQSFEEIRDGKEQILLKRLNRLKRYSKLPESILVEVREMDKLCKKITDNRQVLGQFYNEVEPKAVAKEVFFH